ncbi:hypothetical protein [Thermocrinis sp.]
MFVSVQFKLEFEDKKEREKVLSLMRLQNSAIRFIYNGVVALVLPLLGKAFTRDFSSLPPLLVEGKWKRSALGLVPSGFGGTMPRENTG